MKDRPNGVVWRLLDLVAAVLGLVLLAPLLAFVAAIIRVADGSPVLFRQTRVGRHGATFTLLKFRTMSRASGDVDGVTVANDARVTAVGKHLRRLKLDELPQLINVVRGEMSVVGPRPDMPNVVATFTGSSRDVLAFRPGISCATTLLFDHETELMSQATDPAGYYVRVLAPLKACQAASEMRSATIVTFFDVVRRTLRPGRRAEGSLALQELVRERGVLPNEWVP